MKYKHGLNQYRLNHAKDYAKYILETTVKVELLYHLSKEGYLTEEKAENGITNQIKEIERSVKELLAYIKKRDDMR